MLNFFKKYNLSIRAALMIAILLTLLLFVVPLQGSLDKSWEFLLFFFTIFIVCSIIINLSFKKYVLDKVRVIYKSILNQKGVDENLTLDLQKVDEDVQEFLNNREVELVELKRMETFRREFVGNVSHELKTPIFNIQGYIHTLIDGALYDDAVNIKYLNRTVKSVDRMISIVSDLEVISSLEFNQGELDISNWDIVHLLQEIMDQNEMKAKKSTISLGFDKDNYGPIFVSADRDQIHHVVTNLIVNSIKYGKENGATEVRFLSMGDHILVEVSDNGIGISQDNLPRLFERFYRVDKSRSRKEGGTGLGLSIVKHILEAHNQTINVRSTPNIGSTFSFTLAKSS